MAINGRKIASNSFALYIRMFITIGITFYTSRVILHTLGINDFGTYNVVGGIAVMFSFLSGALTSATVRYITTAVGKEDAAYIIEVFTISVKAHALIGLIVIILSEIVGLWLIYNKLSIPPESITTANFVFQFTVFTTFLSIVNLPYTAAVIADERMTYFAYINIIEAVVKLGISFLIVIFPNRLLAYSGLLMIMSVLIFVLNRWYCKRKLSHIRYNNEIWNPKLFREIAMFSWWNMIKYGAVIGNSQANTIFVNIWGGPAASAAMGIFLQVNAAVTKFFTSFQTAFNPQITKNWASGDRESFNKLILTSSKFSSILFFLPTVPLSIMLDPILSFWLGTVPEDTAVFCQTGFLCLWLDTIVGPMGTGILAIGNIKNYQITSSLIWLSTIPLAWGALVLGMPFKYILIVKFIILIISLSYNLLYLSRKATINSLIFLKSNIVYPAIILICSYGISYWINSLIELNFFARLIVIAFASSSLIVGLTLLIGLNDREKRMAIEFISKIRCRLKRD